MCRVRRWWLRRLQPSRNEGQDRLLPTTKSHFHCGRGLIAVEQLVSDVGVAGLSSSRIPSSSNTGALGVCGHGAEIAELPL
jgi:hypothetical protein